MIPMSFNHGWGVRPRSSTFFAMRDGRVNPSEPETITVTVEGPAVLQGLGSGDPRPDEAITGPTRTTHAGELLAVVRPTGTGSIVIKATAADLPGASVVVDVG